MAKQYFNVLILLFSSWSVYAYCQNDTFLPLFIGGLLILSFVARLKSASKQFVLFDKLPLSTIIILSFVFGFIWRGIFPAPDDATSPFPHITAALQSASIVAVLFIWLKPFVKRNMYQLIFLSWLTVALSINVPFNQKTLFIFCFFCIMATAIVILHTMRKPKNKKNILIYYRDFIIFSTLLVMITTALFYGISKTIVILDKSFMNLMNGLITPKDYTHFLKIDSKLRLGSPGRSAWDKRPVLEISIPEVKGIYLKTQVFGTFEDGIWNEILNEKQIKLPSELDPKMTTAELTMFTSFEDIVPSPSNVVAAKGNVIFNKSADGILYTPDEQQSRILKMSLDTESKPVWLNRKELNTYTSIPTAIAPQLRELAQQVAGDQTDILLKVEQIRDYFQDNFRYSLSVNFTADNDGIIKMIRDKRPAYCSYFASAMVLLLRAEGIPSRVAAGFLTSELSDRRNNTFLTRVNNAHAWTEVLMANQDPVTNQIYYTWRIFDPTPISAMNDTLRSGLQWERLAEKIWLTALRLRAYVESIDKDKVKIGSVLFLGVILLLINRKGFLGYLSKFAKNKTKKRTIKKMTPDHLQSVYSNYENFLKENLNETRKKSDTDNDVIERLNKRSDIPEETLAKIKSFLKYYHLARFGEEETTDLKKILESMKNKKATITPNSQS